MKINWTRVILGGLIAGLIINIFELVVNGLILGSQWDMALKMIGKAGGGAGPATAFWLWGFLIGLCALWLYVTIRPRFGPGVKTAVIAGIGIWVPGSLLAMITPAALHLFWYRLIVHAMSRYPYPAPEHYPDDAAHQAYQREYNTGKAMRFVMRLVAGSK